MVIYNNYYFNYLYLYIKYLSHWSHSGVFWTQMRVYCTRILSTNEVLLYFRYECGFIVFYKQMRFWYILDTHKFLVFFHTIGVLQYFEREWGSLYFRYSRAYIVDSNEFLLFFLREWGSSIFWTRIKLWNTTQLHILSLFLIVFMTCFSITTFLLDLLKRILKSIITTIVIFFFFG